jgi:hypothetical protein
MCTGGIYSPRIRPDLIPVIYRLAKLKGVPMTKYVNSIIDEHIENLKAAANEMQAREITKDIFRKHGWRIPDEKEGNHQPGV